MVDGFLNAVKQALAQGNGIEIRGFGTFKVRHRKATRGPQPQDGGAGWRAGPDISGVQAVQVPARPGRAPRPRSTRPRHRLPHASPATPPFLRVTRRGADSPARNGFPVEVTVLLFAAHRERVGAPEDRRLLAGPGDRRHTSCGAARPGWELDRPSPAGGRGCKSEVRGWRDSPRRRRRSGPDPSRRGGMKTT